jgi:hypothetical protein
LPKCIGRAVLTEILDRFNSEKGYRPAVPLFGAFVKAVNAASFSASPDDYYRSLHGFTAALPAMARHQAELTGQQLSVPLLSLMTRDALLALIEPFLSPFLEKWQLDENAITFYTRLVEKPLIDPALDRALGLDEKTPGEHAAIYKLLAAGLATKGERFAIHPAMPISGKLLRFLVNNIRVREAIKAKKLERDTSEYYRAQFKGTLFETLLDVELPFVIPEKTRSEHGWILGSSGAGKTQLIQLLVFQDLPAVAKDRRSVVVMDSSGDLINQLKNLAVFAPGGPLHGKLIVIEPDVEYPLALNPFDMGRSSLAFSSPRERERLLNNTLDLLEYVFNSMMGEGTTLTPKQSTLFRYCIRLCLVMPGANLQTLVDVISAADIRDYMEYVKKLDEIAQSFFLREFSDDKQFALTKEGVSWRLKRLLEDRTFREMFTSPNSRLDLFTELNSSKVILINTDKELLTEERTTIFGRFFIALLLSASQKRGSLERAERLPVHCYIDEAQDYIKNDPKITVILDQARKMNVGMMLANQRTSQITTPNVLDALFTTSIKFAHTDNPRDASMLAPSLRTSASFIASQKERHFAVHVRGLTPEAMAVKVPFFVVEGMPKMSQTAADEVRQEMRKRYAREAAKPAKGPHVGAIPEPPSERETSEGNDEQRPFDKKPPNRARPSSADGLHPKHDII